MSVCWPLRLRLRGWTFRTQMLSQALVKSGQGSQSTIGTVGEQARLIGAENDADLVAFLFNERPRWPIVARGGHVRWGRGDERNGWQRRDPKEWYEKGEYPLRRVGRLATKTMAVLYTAQAAVRIDARS